MKMANVRVITPLMVFLMLLLLTPISSAEHIVEVEVSQDPTETLPREKQLLM